METKSIKVTLRFLTTMYDSIDGDMCVGSHTAFGQDTEVKIERSVKIRCKGCKKEPRYLVSAERNGKKWYSWRFASDLNSERVTE